MAVVYFVEKTFPINFQSFSTRQSRFSCRRQESNEEFPQTAFKSPKLFMVLWNEPYSGMQMLGYELREFLANLQFRHVLFREKAHFLMSAAYNKLPNMIGEVKCTPC